MNESFDNTHFKLNLRKSGYLICKIELDQGHLNYKKK